MVNSWGIGEVDSGSKVVRVKSRGERVCFRVLLCETDVGCDL